MPSALDLRLDAAYELITGPGGPIQVGSIEKDGRSLPFITNAPTNLGDYVAFFCAQHGDAIFLVEGDERLSFKQVYAAARKVAAGLIETHGVARGDRVGLAMRNANAWCVSYLGILLAGGCATLLNGWWQGGELAAGIEDAEAKLVIADPQRAARLAEPGVAHSAKVVTLDITRPIDEAIAPVSGSADTALPVLTGDDLATILFTSGSTGQSKGAYSRHRSVVQAIFNYVTQTASIVHLLTEDGQMSDIQPATLICTPLFHVTAEIPVFLQSFALGRKLVLMPKWNAEEAMRLIQDEQVNYFVGVPLMSYEILVHPNRKNYDLSTCKSYAGGGAPRPPEHVKRLATEMGEGCRKITAAEAAAHQSLWTQGTARQLGTTPGLVALYLFPEGSGRAAADLSPEHHHLLIPEIFRPLLTEFLTPPWRDLAYDAPDYRDLALNLLGFVPFGFCFYCYRRLRGVRPWFADASFVIMTGTAISLTIEVVQVWLPNRVSSMNDLLGNTLGTVLGVLLTLVVRSKIATGQTVAKTR